MNRRILIVDDAESVHHDFRSILGPSTSLPDALRDIETTSLQTALDRPERPTFELVSAFQPAEALQLVRQSVDSNSPFAMAFIDAGLLVGWDGIETLERIWEIDSMLQAVLGMAFSHDSRDALVDRFGNTDRLLILRKPFDSLEVRQLACALTRKWQLQRDARLPIPSPAGLLQDRTDPVLHARDELLAANEQLEAARLAAERANHAKSAFLANISHEIRTPMTAILGYADVLLTEGDITLAPQDRVQAIDTIRRNGAHLLQLINDLLDLSKIEANELTIERLFCSPLEVTSEVLELMCAPARDRGLTLSVEIDGEIPELIYSDPTRLRQILVNLVGNAIKFTEHGGIRIVLRCAASQTGRPLLQLHVIDTGIGMSQDQLCKLFKPFTQADRSTTRKYGGTGLGLSISKHLAQTLGGDIAVVSELDKGSEFQVTIDPGALEGVRMISQQPTDPAFQQAAAPREADGALRFSGRVLLAEDGIDNQRLFAVMLNRAGLETTVVENGQLACDEYEDSVANGHLYDMILIDMQMPVLDGYEATRRLRQLGCVLPIIAMTAHAMTGDRNACLEAGCSGYIAKPVTPRRLLATIAQHIPQLATSE